MLTDNLTFQDIYEEVEDLTGDSSSSATTKHKMRINDTYKQVLRKFNKRAESTATTVASQQSYELPADLSKVTSVKVTVSSIDYPLKEIVNEDRWNYINDQGTSFTSDTPTHFYIKDNNILIYPTPSSDGDTITYYHTRTDKNMSNDNYTASTIDTVPFEMDFAAVPSEDDVSETLASAWGLPTGVYQVVFDNGDVRSVTLTITKTTATWSTALTEDCTAVTVTVNNLNGGSIVTGTAPTWTALMVGRYLRITSDGYWYKIYSYLDATHITLEKAYTGTELSGATEAYIIGEIPIIPAEYQYALIYRPCMLYFMSKRNPGDAAAYKALHDDIFKNIKPEDTNTTSVIVSSESENIRNPADYPRV